MTSPDDAWSELVRWTRRLYEEPSFAEFEVDYKLEAGARLAKTRAALMGGREEWPDLLREAFRNDNLTDWRLQARFHKWASASPEESRDALSHIWSEAEPGHAEIEAFVAAVPDDVLRTPGALTNIVSYLLMARDPRKYPAYKARVANSALRLLGRVVPEAVSDRYEAFVELLDELRSRIAGSGGPELDRLEAQGALWWTLKDRAELPEDWSEGDRAAVEALRAGSPGPRRKSSSVRAADSGRFIEVRDERSKAVAIPKANEELEDALFLPREWLQETLDLLADKGQVVFYGPPGTGKTYVARALARHLTANGGWMKIVQFHPSFAYEDFFEGYRPVAAGETVTYELKNGPLRQAVDAAREEPDRPAILVVDEINRGDTAKIFGELLFLLEYRDEHVQLQYSPGEPFSLPRNLFLIGTMNTADRSIALVDAALRRRFYFVEFAPTDDPVRSVLSKWLERHELDAEPATLLNALNERITRHEIAIGPSYLMTKDGSPPNVERVWEHAILPVLEEHLYGTGRDVKKEFSLDVLRRSVRGSEVVAVTDGSASRDETEAPESAVTT